MTEIAIEDMDEGDFPMPPDQARRDGADRPETRTVPGSDVALTHLGDALRANGEADGLVEPRPDARQLPAGAAASKHLAVRYFLTVAPLVLSDAIAAALAGQIGALVIQLLSPPNNRLIEAAPPILHLAALFPLPIIYWYGGLYPAIGLHPAMELRVITKLNTTAYLGIMGASLLTGAKWQWTVLFSAGWLASLALVPLLRSFCRRLCGRLKWWGYPAVVISSGDTARSTVAALLARPHCGLRPVGTLDPASRESGIRRLSASPGADGSGHLIAHYGLVALSGPDQARLAEMLERYRRQFPHLLVLSPATGLAGLWRDSRDCGGGLKGTEVRNKLLLPWPVFIKRTMDIVLTLVASTVALPLLLVVAASVKLTSPGPLLFRQRRLGRDGGSFDVWKFRTMRVNADSLLVELLSKDMAARREWELNHKLRNDPRMTPAGTFLRKTSLDELPQLWNVLIGDMSLVGPRPIVSEEIVKYGMIYKVYSEVAPGITGLWQVSGRNDTTYPERIQFDDFYVRNWSPWLDLYILARTITVILFRIGAY